MSLENKSIFDPLDHHIAAKTVETVSRLYYIFTTDLKGNPLLYNYCGNSSSNPYTGFESELPADFKNIVSQLLNKKDQIIADYKEFIAFTDEPDDQNAFLITITRQFNDSNGLRQILIRRIDQFSPLPQDYNAQIRKERKYDRMNARCISSVSHDFRTPLSIIYANLQLLEYHDFHLDKETIEDAFSLSRMAVKSLLRVLDKVTVIDSINKGRLEYRPSKINLKELCEVLVKDLNEAEVIADRVIYIHDPGIDCIELDDYLFRSLFTHLIFNALSYSKKNHKVFFKSCITSTGHVTLSVQDNGIGLTNEQIDAVSTYFSDPEEIHTEGIGLGLAIAKECLYLMKGKLTINSRQGQGSEFIIDLPVYAIAERGKNELTV